MSGNTVTEQAHPDTRQTPSERGPIRVSHAHPIRRPFLNETGRKVRNIALATALTIGGGALGADLLQGSQQPGNQSANLPPPTHIVEEQSPTPKIEIKPNIITVGELNSKRPPTDSLNGIVMIKINNNEDTPALRTSPDTLDDSNLYGAGWSSVTELNGKPISEAVNSNGQTELVLTDPLITRSVNPDDGSATSGIWITMLDQDGKALYVFAGQATSGLVMIEPRPIGNQSMFEHVPPNANALDFGKVSFQNTPQTPAQNS